MSEILNLTVDERPAQVSVTLDWAALTWRDLLAFQEAQKGADAQAVQTLIAGLITKMCGQDALDLPAVVALELGNLVVDRLNGNASPNA